MENLPFLILNGGALIVLTMTFVDYLKDRDEHQAAIDKEDAAASKQQAATYNEIFSGYTQANADLRASAERREAVYQAHNERMATAMAQLNAHQASQISVLKDLTASNDRLEGMVQQLRDAFVGTATPEQRNI